MSEIEARIASDLSLITDVSSANFIAPRIVEFFDSPSTNDVRPGSWDEYDTICGIFVGYRRNLDQSAISAKSTDPSTHIRNVLKSTLSIREVQFGPFDAISTSFSTPVFRDYRKDEIQDIERNRGGMKQVKGLVKCTRCKSDNTSTVAKQLRSADEGMSSIHTCHNCGLVRRENA